MMSARRFVLIATILACAAAPGGPTQAACPTSRPFSSGDYQSEPFGLMSSEADAAFWALGAGSPLPGMGTDSGTLGVCSWIYPDEELCMYEPLVFWISGNWNAQEVDGCIDEAGATPSFDGDECMVMMFAAQDFLGVPHAAIRSRRATGGRFDFSTPGGTLRFSPLPAPTITGVRPREDGLADLTLRLPPGLPAGSSLDAACSQGIFGGSEVFVRGVPPTSGPPPAGVTGPSSPWIPAGPVFPPGQEGVVTADCSAGGDLFFASRPVFDSGFATRYLSLPSERWPAGSDTDRDGLADACDPCVDPDLDGTGNPGAFFSACRTDNCPGEANPGQEDADFDGTGDACERCPGFVDPAPVPLLTDASPQVTLGAFVVPAGRGRVAWIGWHETPAFELYSVAVDGTDRRRLSGPLTQGGNVTSLLATPDGAFLLYVADQRSDEVFELFSVPADGSRPAVRLNGDLTIRGDVRSVQIASRGGRAAYLADQDADERVELYSVPVSGDSPAMKISAAGENVLRVGLSPDGARAVYHTGPGGPLVQPPTGLWSVALTGGPAVRLAGPMKFIGITVITPDSAQAVFAACETEFVNCGVYRVPLAGGELARVTPPSDLLGLNQFFLSPDGTRVVYSAEQDTPDVFDLFMVPLAGGEPVRLSRPFPPGSTGADLFFAARITRDGSRVVFTAEQDTAGVTELYSVPITGGEVIRLNPPLVAGGNVRHPFEWAYSTVFELTHDSRTVIYRADQDRNEVFELYRVPVNGGTAERLHAPLPVSGDVQAFRLSPDGSTVAFTADRTVDGRFEMLATPVGGTPPDVALLGDAPLVPVYGSRGMAQLFEFAPDTPHIVFRSARGLRRTLMNCSQLPPAPHAATVVVLPPAAGPQSDAALLHLVVTLQERSDAEIDAATLAVAVNGTGPLLMSGPPRFAGDRDEDGSPDLRISLLRQDIPLPAADCGPIRFEVTGRLLSGEPFAGTGEARRICVSPAGGD